MSETKLSLDIREHAKEAIALEGDRTSRESTEVGRPFLLLQLRYLMARMHLAVLVPETANE